MDSPKTTRPFRERFLDGYDRSQLRQEVQKVKPVSKLRKKYATWALGASLALGGLGLPIKMIGGGKSGPPASGAARQPVGPAEQPANEPQPAAAAQPAQPAQPAQQQVSQEPQPVEQQLAGDLQVANRIANEVAGGVKAAGTDIAQTVNEPVQKVAQAAPKALAQVADTVKQQFFQREVPFGQIIYSEAKKNDLPPELVAAVVNTESKFVPTARSSRGAIGLMQLVPRTGRWLGARDLTNPVENISAGAKYLKYLSDRFDGDQQKIIAAYNAGEGNVRRFNGVPPFRETRDYVSRVSGFQRDLGDRMQGELMQVAEAR